ncbi:MAG: UDP-N-acetylmuramoyl-tripeptide--D-alanyl-D-alanine ligase, partial [Planctomycetota bacterium]
TARALAELAASYRRSLRARVIGVTGSNGKTTVVRMIDSALRASLTGTASPKSFNNHIGVPLTILAADERDDYLVSEVGMNAPGEIAPLARTLAPDIAIVTTIGHAHIGAFGTTDAIAREKADILTSLAPGGLALLNGDVPELRPIVNNREDVEWFGEHPSNDLSIADIATRTSLTTSFRLHDGTPWSVPAPGRHNAVNAAIAIRVARACGLRDDDIQRGLDAFAPPAMRFEPVEAGGVTFYNDAYNASPESVRAALDTFASLTDGTARRRVVVLGDMLEQGDLAPLLHREAIGHARSIEPDLLIVVGPRFTATGGADHACDEPDAALAAHLRPGDVVLLKGSRGIGLETIIGSVRSNPTDSP